MDQFAGTKDISVHLAMRLGNIAVIIVLINAQMAVFKIGSTNTKIALFIHRLIKQHSKLVMKYNSIYE